MDMHSVQIPMPLNQLFVETTYRSEVNTYASIIEYPVDCVDQLPINTASSIKLQAAALAQLTQSTNLLTRYSLVCLVDELSRLIDQL
jgi:hypothetical protein